MRHSLEGLLNLFPAPYLLSFSTAAAEGLDEDGHTGDPAFVMRSRMLGVPGTSWKMTGMDDNSRAGIARESEVYKQLRPLQVQGSAILLSPQVPDTGWPGWDGVEYVTVDRMQAAVLAFSNFDSPEAAVFQLKHLRPDVTYRVVSADDGEIGAASGDALMHDGIELHSGGVSLAHVLFLSAIPTE
jgi:hypothetical protein